MQLLTLIAAAAEHGEEAAEPSKTAYYVAAAVFSGWALLLAGIGIVRADFLSTVAAKRGAATISLAMFAGTVAAVLATN